jgi:oligopeptidase B
MTDHPAPPPPAAPVARRNTKVDLVHGDRREDEYFWLRRKDDPEVLAHLTAENAYADGVMQPTLAFQEALYREMLGRIKEDDQSVPYRQGAHYYYARTEKGKQHAIMCRKAGVDGPEQITVDLNELAEGHPFIALGAYAVSDDGHHLAYSLDFTGFREFTLYVKDLRTGALTSERIEKVTAVAWTADPAVFLYVSEDGAKRPHRLWRHRLGAAADDLLYEEADALFRLHVARSRSRAYLFAGSRSFTSAELRYAPAGDPAAPWAVLLPREKDHEYEVDHGWDEASAPGRAGERDAGVFYIRTNGGGRRNFRLVRAPAVDPRSERWEELIAHRDDVMLEDVDVFAGHYVVHERVLGLTRLRITPLDGGAAHDVEFPEPAYDIEPEPNEEFAAPAFRFRYQSLITPPSVFDWEFAGRRLLLLKQTEVLGGYDPTRYRSERLHAPAPDGTPVPISLVSAKDAPRDGSSPLVLAGYGAYGIVNGPYFSSNRLSLLERGVSVAIAHVRGGGEMGKRWHDAGKMMQKRNTFTDFIAVADFLVREGYTARDRLVIEGGSAGGLLIGAVLNMRPDLGRAAVLRVPFVDVINTMLDESLPLTVGEFEEWGNPKVREHYEYMKAYCPYTNLDRRRYPAILVRTGINDSQVMYWEPAKWVARLRALKADDHALLFKIDLDAGHGGASGRYDFLREIAFDYAFILRELGLSG